MNGDPVIVPSWMLGVWLVRVTVTVKELENVDPAVFVAFARNV
jgi:hypothetical protein